jgi:hypothetical protein
LEITVAISGAFIFLLHLWWFHQVRWFFPHYCLDGKTQKYLEGGPENLFRQYFDLFPITKMHFINFQELSQKLSRNWELSCLIQRNISTTFFHIYQHFHILHFWIIGGGEQAVSCDFPFLECSCKLSELAEHTHNAIKMCANFLM